MDKKYTREAFRQRIKERFSRKGLNQDSTDLVERLRQTIKPKSAKI